MVVGRLMLKFLTKLISVVIFIAFAMNIRIAAADELTEKKFKFLGSVTWECDDRFAFDGAEGGLHDTTSALKFDMDGNGRFTGFMSTSLPYGEGQFNRRYTFSGYEFDEDGKVGVVIDNFTLISRDNLPEGYGWRDLDRITYYINLVDDAMSLEGVWEDKSGGHSRTDCG